MSFLSVIEQFICSGYNMRAEPNSHFQFSLHVRGIMGCNTDRRATLRCLHACISSQPEMQSKPVPLSLPFPHLWPHSVPRRYPAFRPRWRNQGAHNASNRRPDKSLRSLDHHMRWEAIDPHLPQSLRGGRPLHPCSHRGAFARVVRHSRDYYRQIRQFQDTRLRPRPDRS